jgi:CBS domain-containing protein
MVRLRDIMTTEVVTIPFDVSIRDAMSILSTRHISGAPVVDGTGIVGVVTATDLMAFAAEVAGAPAETFPPVDLENLPPSTDDPEPPGEEPSATFFTEMWEDAGVDASTRMSQTAGAEWNVLDEHTVAEAMTRAPLFRVDGTTTLPAAAEFMRLHDVRRLLVMDGDRVVGIVTATDIANAVADHKLRERTYVFGKESHFTGSPDTVRRSSTLGDQSHKR